MLMLLTSIVITLGAAVWVWKAARETIRNWIGKLELGSGVSLMVDPDDPYAPAAADRDSTVRGLMGGIATLAVTILLTWWAYALRF